MMFLKAVSAGRRIYPVVTDKLNLYLDAYNTRSYNGTGSTWYDLSNSGYNFTNSGSTWTTSGSLRYWELDGVNDRIEGNANTTIFNFGTNGWTWSIWANYVTSPAAFDVLISAEFATTIPYFIDNVNAAGTTGNGFRGGSYSASQSRAWTFHDVTIGTNAWKHYCLTFTYTSSTQGTFNWYVDGSSVSSYSKTLSGAGITWASYDNSKKPVIGALLSSGTYSRFNNIKVGEVLNYTKTLTATEVSNNYNATKSNYGL